MKISLKEVLILFMSCLAYAGLAYHTDRSDFPTVLLMFVIAFLAYGYLSGRILTGNSNFEPEKITFWITVAILFRLIFVASVPALSDDFYRFLWDGMLLAGGENPYLILPDHALGNENIMSLPQSGHLYGYMNSPGYYTVYPPVLEAIFGFSSWISSGNLLSGVIVLRMIILIAEAGTILLMRRLTEKLGLNPAVVLLYALNPLVIVELTGNLHPEALMIFFLMLSFSLLYEGKWKISAVFFGISVATKLLPLMLLPAIFVKRGRREGFLYSTIAVFTAIVLFLPFFHPDMAAKFFSSVDLYFRTFEFNASIYYLVRWLGFEFAGYNIIGTAGPLLSLLTIFLVLWILFSGRNREWKPFFSSLLLALSCYLWFSTTVHPWYLTTLVALGVFAPKSYYVFAWSALIILSYAAYANDAYREVWWLVLAEYLVVFGWFAAGRLNLGRIGGPLIGGND